MLPAPTLALWFLTMLVEGYSLLLAAFALLGGALAALAYRARVSRTSLVAAAFGATTIMLSLVPLAQAWRITSEEGVTLSLPEHFALPWFFAEGSPETITYARPEGEELKLDVWRPPE